jgi:hypothetical protein
MSKKRVTATATSYGMTLSTFLTGIFILCKVLEVSPIVAWSWWWVFSPLWISFLVSISIMALIFLGAVVYFLIVDNSKF